MERGRLSRTSPSASSCARQDAGAPLCVFVSRKGPVSHAGSSATYVIALISLIVQRYRMRRRFTVCHRARQPLRERCQHHDGTVQTTPPSATSPTRAHPDTPPPPPTPAMFPATSPAISANVPAKTASPAMLLTCSHLLIQAPLAEGDHPPANIPATSPAISWSAPQRPDHRAEAQPY